MINYWFNPCSDQLGTSAEQFIQILQQPTLIHIPGQDRSRNRALCTLLHGNEPSGTRALHRWLTQRERLPAVDILCFFGAVKTALAEPGFYYRQLPGEPDLNRCFKPPFTSPQGQIAEHYLQLLELTKPEALIDIHNTSGMGPSFAVTRKLDSAHETLASLFTERLLLTELRLGALFEYSERNVPTVTVECGGPDDPHSDQMAYEGILNFVNQADVLTPVPRDWPMEVLQEPVRLEIQPGASVCYQESFNPNCDLTLFPDVERHNFGSIQPDEPLGWIRPESWQKLSMKTPNGKEVLNQLLVERQGKLFPARPLKLFMITTNPTIAVSDCIFYAIAQDSSHL